MHVATKFFQKSTDWLSKYISLSEVILMQLIYHKTLNYTKLTRINRVCSPSESHFKLPQPAENGYRQQLGNNENKHDKFTKHKGNKLNKIQLFT